jgi:hypothetical protein
MKLHTFLDEFRDLIAIVADRKHLPESAIERDYYIVCLLKNLAESPYAEQCVFKGGTSLSKCYPGSIERFIEAAMTVGAETEKIIAERSNRSKSMYVWFGTRENQIKLEIGSSIRPDLSSAYSYFYDLFLAIVPGLMTLEPSPTVLLFFLT